MSPATDAHSYVEYWIDKPGLYWVEDLNDINGGKWRNMSERGYLVPVLGDLEMEEAAELLAERVGKDRPDLMEEAYKAAVHQLLTKDFEKEWADLQWNMFLHKKWGGTPPSLVLVPDEVDPKEWHAVVPNHRTGDPVTYKVRQKTIQDIIPPPNDQNAVRTPMGWLSRPTPERAQANRAIRRAQAARLRRMK